MTRRVKVKVPGKHFPHGHSELSPAEQREFDWGTAIEHKERHIFALHRKASGAAHSGPGIRFLCDSNAIDGPDHKGFWTALLLRNRWRHDTYSDAALADEELQWHGIGGRAHDIRDALGCAHRLSFELTLSIMGQFGVWCSRRGYVRITVIEILHSHSLHLHFFLAPCTRTLSAAKWLHSLCTCTSSAATSPALSL